MKTQWLPVAASLENKEASLLLLSLYMGKLMGVGQGVGEAKVRLSSGHVVVENRLLGRADQGWVVGEGMVVWWEWGSQGVEVWESGAVKERVWQWERLAVSMRVDEQ